MTTALAVLSLTACSSGGGDVAPDTTVVAAESETTAASAETSADAAASIAFDPATSTPCEIFTVAEIEEAFGEPVTVDDSQSGECWWETGTRLKTVTFVRDSAPDTDEALEAWRSGFDNDQWEPIDLGSGGYRGKGVPSVDWIQGGYRFQVNLAWSTKGDPYPIAERLARLAASRIVE